MDNVVDRYFPVLDALETELEKIEEQIFERNAARGNIQALYALKQKLMTLKHAVDPLMEATGKLYGGRVPQICAGMSEYFRDVYDHLHRIHASIEGIREMLTTAIQVNLGMISLAENEVTKKLAAWAAIIAVPTMVAGIYGMNFEHMPELKWTFGYPLAIGVMVVVDVYLYFHFTQAEVALACAGLPRHGRARAVGARRESRADPPSRARRHGPRRLQRRVTIP